MDWAPTFAGLEIAPGPLYYNGTSFEIKDNWNYDSYDSVYGKTAGSTYFNFIEMGQLFEKADFSESDGNIENLLDPLDGWRLPTQTEWAAITTNTTAREGSTVNGRAGQHYAMIELTGVMHAGSSYPAGLLIFPDGKTITGLILGEMDNETLNTDVTESELNAYLSQGCVFLPASGHWSNGTYYEGGHIGYYWTSNELSSYTGESYFLQSVSMYGYVELIILSGRKDLYNSVRLVK